MPQSQRGTGEAPARPAQHPPRAGAGIDRRDGAGVRIGALCTITELSATRWCAQHFADPRRGRRPFRQRPDPQRGHAGRQRLQRVAGRRPADRRCSCWTPRSSWPRSRTAASPARRMPLAEFFVGPGKTQRAPDELLLRGLRCRCRRRALCRASSSSARDPALDISDHFDRHRRRHATGGALTDVRVAFGAVAPMPMRAPRTEAALEGRRARRRRDRRAIAGIARATKSRRSTTCAPRPGTAGNSYPT